jgi:aryl sulfotransferase
MSGIIWLASYPKSGNTWFRIFLTNLLRDSDTPASINELEKTPIASAREIFDQNIGFDSSDLSADEIDRLRPELYCFMAEEAKEPLFMKIHDAYIEVADNTPLIPQEATVCAIYFVRNPLDVAVSFAHHNGTDYDTAITNMANDVFTFCGKSKRLHKQLRQKLLTWSDHVLSWADAAPFPVCLLRYEDMKVKPLETFRRAVQFAGLHHSDTQIEKALAFSKFEVVQQQEESEGFQEKSAVSNCFFRKGESGSWREELSQNQVARIIRDHGEVMRRFGYLNEHEDIEVEN